MPLDPPRPRARRFLAPSAAAMLLAAAGCYERVVREEPGIGRGKATVYESDLENSRVPVFDDMLDFAFDEDTKPKESSRRPTRKRR